MFVAADFDFPALDLEEYFSEMIPVADHRLGAEDQCWGTWLRRLFPPVEGNKRVVVSGEERIIRISGIVRPIDISLTNTVSSTTLANFAISYTGKGPQSRFTNQNYLSKILNYVWPF